MKVKIEFGDLKLDDRVKMNFLSILESNWASEGPLVEKFEQEWGKLFSYSYNTAMANGTSADMACCMTLYDSHNAKRGDEIIAPALEFAAVGNSIISAGFNPIFVDIERETLNINPDKIEEKITPKTKAIMAVHTMGKPCMMEKISDIAKKYHLCVIEDACEAHGAQYKDKFVGKWGDMASFSFYAAHLVCCGEGGMVSTDNSDISNLLKSIKSHGRNPGEVYFDHQRLGLNFKMNDLEAAVGLPQIEDFWGTFNKRRINLKYLLDKTKDLDEYAYFNSESKDEVVCAHGFSVTLKDPRFNLQDLYKFLEDNSIKCKRNFGSMPTQQKAFEFLGHELGEFPESEYAGDNGLHFGIHQYLSREDLDYISDKLHEYFEKF